MILDDDFEYTEPICLMCDDTGVIEDPETGDIQPCQYCDAKDINAID